MIAEQYYPTIDESATPDFVLAVLRDMHRQHSHANFGTDPEAPLLFASTVKEWQDACGCSDWQEIMQGQNEFWRIDINEDDWRGVLTPVDEKRLDGVCELLARYVRRPRIRPANFLGYSSRRAGTFLTIRSLLHEAGVDPEEIAPSTILSTFTRRYCKVFLGSISRLAPGALPSVRIRSQTWETIVWMIFVVTGGLCMLVGAFGKQWLLFIAGGFLLVVAHLIVLAAAKWLLPKSVEFGELRTFRDLALIIAEVAEADLTQAPSAQTATSSRPKTTPGS